MSEFLLLMHGDAVDEGAADWPAYLDGLARGGRRCLLSPGRRVATRLGPSDRLHQGCGGEFAGRAILPGRQSRP